MYFTRQQSGAVNKAVASKQEGSWFKSPGQLGLSCVAFVLTVLTGLLWAPLFLPQSKNMFVRFTGDSKLAVKIVCKLLKESECNTFHYACAMYNIVSLTA